MQSVPPLSSRSGRRGNRRDWGRLVARILCAVFALIGTLPLAAGAALRSDHVRQRAAETTADVLKRELGIEASYGVEVSLLPFRVTLTDVVVPATDGGKPVLTAEKVTAEPRIFSLLAGRVDVGEVEVERPRIRAILRDGKLANLDFELPESSGSGKKSNRAPFESLAMSGAVVELSVDDDVGIRTGPIDLDVFAERGPAFEIALRAGESHIDRTRRVPVTDDGEGDDDAPQRTVPARDEDRLCRLDLRVRIDGDDILVRRLSLLGAADQKADIGTRPSCESAVTGDESARVALRLSQVAVKLREGGPPKIRGRVVASAPLHLIGRFAPVRLRGWAGVAVDVIWDGESKLPAVDGKVRAGGLRLDQFRLAKRFEADVKVQGESVELPRFEVDWANGTFVGTDLELKPFAKKPELQLASLRGTKVDFPGIMRDLGVTPNTIVSWDIDEVNIERFGGTLDPLDLDGSLSARTSDFEVTDRAWHDPARQHMIGVRTASLRARVGVTPSSFDFYDTRAAFGTSVLRAAIVAIGFDNDLRVELTRGTSVNLEDISPLVDLPMAGRLDLTAELAGKNENPLLTGEGRVDDLWFAGFPIGDIDKANLRFRPLWLELTGVEGRKGSSKYRVSSAKLDFDTEAIVEADAHVTSDDFGLRDFFAMWHFDEDPRFAGIAGRGAVDARVRYDLGGSQDRCGDGYLRVAGDAQLHELEVFDERYDSGEASFDFRWLDSRASHLGMVVDVPSFMVTKGEGSALGSLTIRPGGVLRAHAVATDIPLAKLQSLGGLGPVLEGRASGFAEVHGTIDQMAADVHVNVSPVRIGAATLPASSVAVKLEPIPRKQTYLPGRTGCDRPVPGEFDRGEYERDEPAGVFVASGSVFGNQIEFSNLRVTRQRDKHVKGDIRFNGLDLGSLAELSPTGAGRLSGKLSAQISIEDLPLEDQTDTRAKAWVRSLELERAGLELEVQRESKPIVVRDGRVEFPGIAMVVTTPGGQQGRFDVAGVVSDLAGARRIDAQLRLRPTQLSAFTGLIPRAERASGVLEGTLRVSGTPGNIEYGGGFRLKNGEIAIRGLPTPLSRIDVALAVDSNEVRITRATAEVGGGTLSVRGGTKLDGFSPGDARATIRARGISLAPVDGVSMTLDADLAARWSPSASIDQRSLPRVTGDVAIRSFEYTRPVTMSADINTLAQRGSRTEVESYDPADDTIEFDVTLKADKPLQLRNNLLEAELRVDRDGLVLAGTNQRFGMRGLVELRKGGRIRLRRSEFEIRRGQIRFDDLSRISPEVDVTATTEYRRYSDASATDAGGAGASGGTTTGTGNTGGHWRITMRAHGDAEKLRIDLTSEPELAQDDIFLLLTVGLTRAELDQARGLGESVALEALGRLTGADTAVTEALPVIDDFSFGSAYSSRTGRTEPTVTIGKRLADRIRARVTTGVSESREVRSNLEWRLSPRVSVEGSYDNVNDISNSTLGNLGADIRWRLEFE